MKSFWLTKCYIRLCCLYIFMTYDIILQSCEVFTQLRRELRRLPQSYTLIEDKCTGK